MTVNYTTNLALGQPVTGSESGTWGDDVNNAVTSYLDIAIAGGLAITVTTADVTLTLTQGTSVATNIGSTTAQYAILNVSGAMTAARNLIVPSSSRSYVVNNSTTGGFALTVKGAATTGVTLVNGEKAHVFWNGTDYAKLSNAQGGAGSFTTLSASSTTTLSGLTASTALALDASKNVVSVTNTGSGNNVLSTSPTLVTPILGTPASGVATNLTGLPLTTGVTGTLPTANGGTNLTSFTANGVVYASSSSALTTGSALTFDGTNLGIGTNLPTSKLHVAGATTTQLQVQMSGQADMRIISDTGYGALSVESAMPLIFRTSATERARIDSSGNLLVGNTSVPSGLSGQFVVGSTRPLAYDYNTGSLQIKAEAGGWNLATFFFGSSGTNRGGFGVAGSNDTLSYYFVGQSGAGAGVQLANGGTSWAALSDEREKNIYGEITDALEKVSQISGLYFNYKTDESGSRRRVGFSAQKVQTVLPEAVTELERDFDNPTEDTKRLTLSATDMLPLLVQAIKEQQALITALTARITALESSTLQ